MHRPPLQSTSTKLRHCTTLASESLARPPTHRRHAHHEGTCFEQRKQFRRKLSLGLGFPACNTSIGQASLQPENSGALLLSDRAVLFDLVPQVLAIRLDSSVLGTCFGRSQETCGELFHWLFLQLKAVGERHVL